MTKLKLEKLKKCAFCGKDEDRIKFLVAGPGVSICDECVDLCSKIIEANIPEEEDESIDIQGLPTPSKIKSYLDEYVIGQEKAKRYLAVAVYNHYKRVYSSNTESGVNVQKSNILLIGPTGSGKTLLIESLAKFLNVPFAITDSTGLTEAGYVGDDISNILTRLYQNADGDIEKVERGIVYIDEIDKKRKMYGINNRDVSGEGVQQALLKVIEGGVFEISVSNPRDKALGDKKVSINTKNILFVCGGAFVGLDKKIASRMNIGKQVIGFDIDNDKDNADKKEDIDFLLSNVETQDLVSFGMIPEFLGRLPIIAVLNSLKEDDLVHILTEPKDSLISQYTELFKKDNHALKFEDDALLLIAKTAIEQKTGARGLRGIIERVLIDLQYTIPDEKSEENVKPVIITKEFVKKRIETPIN